MGYYRKFTPHYATRTIHLTGYLGGKQPENVIWTTQVEKKCTNLKAAITNESVLSPPNFKLPFILQTDASSRGIGVVFSQVFKDDEEKPVAYFYKKLNGAQRNYTATEKECLVVVLAIRHFCCLRDGEKNQLVLQTDHKALQRLSTMENGNQRLMIWSLSLQPFYFVVEHRPGNLHSNNADGLAWQRYPELSRWRGIHVRITNLKFVHP